jgi:hypothetical protein
LWTTNCPISGSSLSSARSQPFSHSSLCLLKVHREINSCPYPLLQCAFRIPAPLLCVSFQFFVYCSVFFWGEESVCPGGYAGLSQEWLGEYCVSLDVHLFGLLDVSLLAGLELVSGGVGALLFSQCNVVWRSFLWAGGSGC